MRMRGVRGAVQLEQDSAEQMVKSVSDLLFQMLTANGIKTEDLISIILTSTPDLVSEFPALAARKIGLGSVPLLCSVEINVAGALPRVVRVLMHAHMEKDLAQIKHIYLGGAAVLRKDIAQ